MIAKEVAEFTAGSRLVVEQVYDSSVIGVYKHTPHQYAFRLKANDVLKAVEKANAEGLVIEYFDLDFDVDAESGNVDQMTLKLLTLMEEPEEVRIARIAAEEKRKLSSYMYHLKNLIIEADAAGLGYTIPQELRMNVRDDED